MVTICHDVVKELWSSDEFTEIEKTTIISSNSKMNTQFRVRVLNSIRNHIAYKNRSNLSYKRKGVSPDQKQALIAKKKYCYVASALMDSEPSPFNEAASTLQRLQSQVISNNSSSSNNIHNNNSLNDSFSQMMGSFTL